MGERADRERVRDGADADRAAEQPPGGEHGELDAGTDEADRVAARGEPGHQAVAGPGAETRTDVGAGREAAEDDAADHQPRSGHEVARRRE